MFGTYLRRELVGRRKQTIIIAIGMALAIALVIVVNSVAAGVRTAQASVLESVYGVGTDITVSQAAEAPAAGEGGPGQNFDFGSGDGSTSDGTTTVNQSRLEAARGTSTFDATALGTITDVANVEAAAATLSLTNTTFTGELPDFSQAQGSDGTEGVPGGDATGATPPQGGPDGAGGSSFGVDSFTVLGLDPSGDAVGPLSAVTLSDGRSLATGDAGTDVAVLDASYATEAGLATGDTIDIAGTTFSVIGTVSATGADTTTASNVYIPLDVAQTLAGLDGQVSQVSVQAASSTDIAQVQADIEAALPDATVSTQDDLASTVSGSLASASTLVSNLGTWLSLIVLAAAFLIAILFTISGVTRRTREFGTLKAIGWSNRRIVGQVAGESVVQSLIGGAVGVAVGLVGILIVNLVAPTLSAAATTSAGGGFGGPGGAGLTSDAATGSSGGFGGAPGGTAAATTDVVLQAPVTAWIIVIAVGIAILGGLLAGAVGGWRASRLRPAEALRSVA